MLPVTLINPFITATLDITRGITVVAPRRGQPFAKRDRRAEGDISGVIALDGTLVGSVALTFPAALARAMYENMVGEKAIGLTREVQDAVGEIVNLIAGSAKKALADHGHSYRLGLPSVVVGRSHQIGSCADRPSLVVPFCAEPDTFWLEVSCALREPSTAHG